MSAQHWPSELRLTQGGRVLIVAFEAASFELGAEYLRVKSPSAEIKGHAPSQRKTVGGKRHVLIRAVEPVGHYAVKLVFDDGHDTGLYTWDYLHTLGADAAAQWSAYLADLAAKSLSRDRAGEG